MKRYKLHFSLIFNKCINFIPSININLLDYDNDFQVIISIPEFSFCWFGIEFEINIGNEYEWNKYLIQKNGLED